MGLLNLIKLKSNTSFGIHIDIRKEQYRLLQTYIYEVKMYVLIQVRKCIQVRNMLGRNGSYRQSLESHSIESVYFASSTKEADSLAQELCAPDRRSAGVHMGVEECQEFIGQTRCRMFKQINDSSGHFQVFVIPILMKPVLSRRPRMAAVLQRNGEIEVCSGSPSRMKRYLEKAKKLGHSVSMHRVKYFS